MNRNFENNIVENERKVYLLRDSGIRKKGKKGVKKRFG